MNAPICPQTSEESESSQLLKIKLDERDRHLPGNEVDDIQERDIDIKEISYAIGAFYATLQPVAITLVLSSLAVVYIVSPFSQERADGGLSVYDISDGSDADINDSNTVKLGKSLINAIVIVCAMAIMTFVIVFLYWARCMRFIQGYMIFSSFMLLCFMGGIFLYTVICQFQIPFDWITFFVLLYNFSVVGVIAIFYQQGIPTLMTQGYLICTSILLVWQLSRFDEYTCFSLLVALSFYDLCAVLSPYGPLKALVTLMQERNVPLPGLLYEANMSVRSSADAGSDLSGSYSSSQGSRRRSSSYRNRNINSSNDNGNNSNDNNNNNNNNNNDSSSINNNNDNNNNKSRIGTNPFTEIITPDHPAAECRTPATNSPFIRDIRGGTYNAVMHLPALYEDSADSADAADTLNPMHARRDTGTNTCNEKNEKNGNHERRASINMIGIVGGNVGGKETVNTGSSKGINVSATLPVEEEVEMKVTRSNSIASEINLDYLSFSSRSSYSADSFDLPRKISQGSAGGSMGGSKGGSVGGSVGADRGDRGDKQGSILGDVSGTREDRGDRGDRGDIEENYGDDTIDSRDRELYDSGSESGSSTVGVSSVKLGLGDFVFYSLLVSRSSTHGFPTFIATSFVVLAGLGVTLTLLAVYKKALPALPISILLGVVAYFLTRFLVEPFLTALAQGPLYL